MSKRTERRAAERQAHKANRLNALAPTPIAAEPIAVAEPEPEIQPQPQRTAGHLSRFVTLAFESRQNFTNLADSFYADLNPQSDLEQRLVDSIIQHHWLKERAIHLQEELMAQCDDPAHVNSTQLSLFVRYQTTHERSYYKALKELQNLQKQKRQDQIGFESQNRKQESHEAAVRLTNARAQNIEIDSLCRQTMEVRLPGHERIGFEELTQACSSAISTLIFQKHHQAAA